MTISGVYTSDEILSGVALEDLTSGMLEDSTIYASNSYLKNLPIFKLAIPFVTQTINLLTGREAEIILSLTSAEIGNLFIFTLANSILLLPSLRFYDKIVDGYKRKFRLTKTNNNITFLDRIIITAFDLIYRMILVFGCSMASAMLSLAIAFYMSDFSDVQKFIILIISMLVVCLLSALLHKGIFQLKETKGLKLFLDFSKTVFVDLLYTVLALFFMVSTLMMNYTNNMFDMGILLLGEIICIALMFFVGKLISDE